MVWWLVLYLLRHHVVLAWGPTRYIYLSREMTLRGEKTMNKLSRKFVLEVQRKWTTKGYIAGQAANLKRIFEPQMAGCYIAHSSPRPTKAPSNLRVSVLLMSLYFLLQQSTNLGALKPCIWSLAYRPPRVVLPLDDMGDKVGQFLC
jgi:hypothetical protein